MEAVLAELRQADIDQIVVGGDVVPGPMPRETLRRLLDLDARAFRSATCWSYLRPGK